MPNTQPSPATHIIIKGARQHNLKNIDLNIPKNQLVVMTGLSGSGKSSLAFDTIYAEGQRKYVESLSAYARQFLGLMQKPDVDQIEGLSPAISIDQKTTSQNPRSTVGTITEVYDYLRLLFARIGHPHCPQCGLDIAPQSLDQIVNAALHQLTESTGLQPTRWLILSPLVRDKKGEYTGLFSNLRQKGFNRVRVDNRVFRLEEDIGLIKTNKHTIEVLTDRITIDRKQLQDDSMRHELQSRLSKAFEAALELANGAALLVQVKDNALDFPENPQDMTDRLFSQNLACPNCHLSFGEVEPRLFSFNTPHGACPTCTGLGTLLKVDPHKIVAPNLTLSEGAIIPLATAFTNNTWLARKIHSILTHHGLDSKTLYKDLPPKVQAIILDGDVKTYQVSGTNREGEQTSFSTQFEGVINILERRHSETQSDFIRKQLEEFMAKETCPACHGARLKPEALAVTITDLNIFQVTNQSISLTHQWTNRLHEAVNNPQDTLLNAQEKTIATMVVREIKSRLQFLVSVGLEYLQLNREAASLAGGEAQRIRLASQIGTGLTGVLYVLDEPSIGLHARDNDRLIQTLVNLKNLGNSVLVVEHDEAIMKMCDYLIDIGPLAGEAGGQVIFAGLPQDILKEPNSITGKYLSGKKKIKLSHQPSAISHKNSSTLRTSGASGTFGTSDTSRNLHPSLSLHGAAAHNLKGIDVEFPLGKLVVVTGVSGSGKSTLVHDTLYPAIRRELGLTVDHQIQYDRLDGVQNIKRVSLIDQSPIGRTPRSNPATYTKAFDYIRQIFANTRDARERGYQPGRFSFNVKGGRCEACRGDGQVKISMQFLPDVYVTCDVCKGKRYNNETLSVFYQHQTIADILDLTIDKALEVFKNHSYLRQKLVTLQQVGLGYIQLGQPAPTLSGGEAQRIKLAKELSTMSAGHTMYILDEPTTGLHFEDVNKLLQVLKQLIQQNNTVIVIEHNLDIIKNADWLIDLGPEGGDGGGQLLITGTPREVAQSGIGYTAQYLQ